MLAKEQKIWLQQFLDDWTRETMKSIAIWESKKRNRRKVYKPLKKFTSQPMSPETVWIKNHLKDTCKNWRSYRRNRKHIQPKPNWYHFWIDPNRIHKLFSSNREAYPSGIYVFGKTIGDWIK